jgi:hypothetical protein
MVWQRLLPLKYGTQSGESELTLSSDTLQMLTKAGMEYFVRLNQNSFARPSNLSSFWMLGRGLARGRGEQSEDLFAHQPRLT